MYIINQKVGERNNLWYCKWVSLHREAAKQEKNVKEEKISIKKT